MIIKFNQITVTGISHQVNYDWHDKTVSFLTCSSVNSQITRAIMNQNEISTSLEVIRDRMPFRPMKQTYQQQIEECQKTIIQLRKTIYSMEKQIEQLYIIQMIDDYDHRVIS